MLVRTSKYCDACKKRVATKFLLWHTIEDYVTIRGDDAPGYSNYEDRTVRADRYYCRSCWTAIVRSIATKQKEPLIDVD